jgi:hypothetical protein
LLSNFAVVLGKMLQCRFHSPKRFLDPIHFLLQDQHAPFERGIVRTAASPAERYDIHLGVPDFSISIGLEASRKGPLKCCSMCPQRMHANVMTGRYVGLASLSPMINVCRSEGRM